MGFGGALGARGGAAAAGVVEEDAPLAVAPVGETERAAMAAIASIFDFLGALPRTSSYKGG